MDNCIFCKIIAGDIPSHVLAENEHAVALMSLEGHPLIVTKQHFDDIFTMDEDTAASVMSLAIKVAKAVKTGLNADGVKVVQNNGTAAGQDVMHYHLHIRQKYTRESHTNIPHEVVDDEQRKSTFEKIKSKL